MLQLLTVHGGKEIEGHQSKVHRPTGWIEQGQLTHGFERHCWNHTSQRHQVAPLTRQSALRMHLDPVASKAILDQEAHNPAWGEELGSSRQIFMAHLLLLLVEPGKDSLLLLLMEILVEPSDRLLISGYPRRAQCWCIQQCKELMQGRGAGEELARQIGRIEEER